MNRNPNLPPSQNEHPDELTLVGWCEGRLLAFERDEVESHLASCKDCRDLVATIEPAVHGQPDVEGVVDQASGPAHGRHSTRQGAPAWRTWLAAAAVLLLIFVLNRDRTEPRVASQFELALGSSREAVFDVLRDSPSISDDVFVGVRLEFEAWVRLIAVDDLGQVHEIPLDPEGSVSAPYPGQSEHIFGPYPIAFAPGRVLNAVVALVSDTNLAWPTIELLDWQHALAEDAFENLSKRLGAQVRVSRIQSP